MPVSSLSWSSVAELRSTKPDFGALEAADFAISLAPDAVPVNGNRAHALMFLGHVDEARSVYLRFRGKKSQGAKSWEDEVRDDFADLRKHGLSHPLMDEVEEAFKASAPS